jgi:integrase
MTAMSQTYHLLRRNGVWSYRRRVPTHLVEAFGKEIIQFSLATRSLTEAKKRRAAEDLKWSTRFEAAEKSLGRGASNPDPERAAPPALSRGEVIRLVQEYVEQTDERARQSLLCDPPESEDQKAEMKVRKEVDLQTLRDRDDPNAAASIYLTGKKILGGAGVSIEGLPYPEFVEFVELVRRALVEVEQRKLARLNDDHQHPFFDQLFGGDRSPQVTFGELADQFMALTEEHAAANRTSQKWVDKQRANVALLRDIIGNATPIREVDYDACLRVRSVLGRLPAKRNQHYKGLSVDEAVARGKEEGRPLLEPFSQGRYLATLRAVLDLAAKKRLIGFNPAAGLRPLKRDDVAPADKRAPFTLKQIATFFQSEFYQQCAASGPLPYRFDKTGGWRFWLAPIMLFAVLRPNEICQLHIDDIRRTEQGTWYFDVVASTHGDDVAVPKTLKTASSRRRVPLHPELMAMGFLQFIEDRRTSGSGARLFPELTPDKYGNYADYPLRRFNATFLPEAIEMSARQSTYSFRHSARDALRRIDAPPDVLQALGWSQARLVSDDYGDRSNPDYLAQYVRKIGYPGLGLTALYVKEH